MLVPVCVCHGIFELFPTPPRGRKKKKSFALTIMDSSESCYQKVTRKERDVVLRSNRNPSSVVPSRSPQNRGKFYSDISIENQTFWDQRQWFKTSLTLFPLSLESDDVAQNLLCPVEWNVWDHHVAKLSTKHNKELRPDMVRVSEKADGNTFWRTAGRQGCEAKRLQRFVTRRAGI